MASRRELPDILGEALGRMRIPTPEPRPKVVQIPTDYTPQLEPLMTKLQGLKLKGMASAMAELESSAKTRGLSFEQRLEMMVNREIKERENRKLTSRLRMAKLRLDARMEDIDYQHDRGLDKSQMLFLALCGWITEHNNVIITGPTGVGKTFLACALTRKVCLEGHRACYHRLPSLLRRLAKARREGDYQKVMSKLAKFDLLTLDDWGVEKLDQVERLDLLELLEDRYGRRSTMVTSQIPVENWPQIIGDHKIGEAIMDRLVPNAHAITLQGDSLRSAYSTVSEGE